MVASNTRDEEEKESIGQENVFEKRERYLAKSKDELGLNQLLFGDGMKPRQLILKIIKQVFSQMQILVLSLVGFITGQDDGALRLS